MDKGEMIDILVQDDLFNIFSSSEYGDTECVHNILYSGFKGYENYDYDELVTECRERGLYDDGENIDIELEK